MLSLNFCLVYLVFCGAFIATGGTGCPKDTFLQLLDNDDQTCCEMCPPGFYVDRSCDHHNGTRCKPCKPGETYMDTKTSKRECKRCLLNCEPSQVIQHPCNATHNTVCGCRKGEYLHKETVMCTPCSPCDKGFGVKTQCTTNGDTVCHPCPLGTFSSIKSTTAQCQQCTQCAQIVVKTCTAKTDGVCGNKTNEDTTQPPTGSTILIKSTKSRRSKAKSSLYIVFGFCLGLLLAGIFIGFLCWYIKRRRVNDVIQNSPCEIVNAEEEMRGGEELLAIPRALSETYMTQETQTRASSSRGLRGRRKHRSAIEKNNLDASSSGSSSSLQGITDGEMTNGLPSKLVRDLCYDVIFGIATLLNPKGPNNWKKLAARLGYKQIQVSNFNMDPSESTQSMLRDWGTKDTSTVEVLYQHLMEMRRHDAAKLLRKYR